MQCLRMIIVYHDEKAHKVACGKCAFCLVNKRSAWMFRIHHELRRQEMPGYFLTLTYSDKYLPEREGIPSLRFRDVQLFLKQIRKRKYNAKYVCVGEYGPNTQRPHYHCLLWTDCPPQDLEKIWHRGHIQFGSLTMASAMYTLKYIIQPKNVDRVKRERPRAQFSKGIGLAYMDNAAYNYHNDDENNPTMFVYLDGRKVALPKYYKDKIFTKYQLREEALKTRDQSITESAKQIREAMKKVRGKKTIVARLKEARAYLLELRAEECRRIIETTKFNQTL